MFSPPRGRPSGTTSTTVVQPPSPSPRPPPPPLVLKPAAPAQVFVEPELDEISERKYTRAEEAAARQAVSYVPQALLQLFPPKSVLPDQFSAQKGGRLVMTENLGGDSVGLLNRLSLYPSYLLHMYQRLQERCSSDQWNSVVTRLFGQAKNRDHFLGYGRRKIPGHDQMGLFPMFVDQHGREYFEVPSTNGTEFTVRIPRHLTRRQNARLYTPVKDEIQFPDPNEEVVLSPCGLPLFPFYWDSMKNDVRSISEASATNDGLFAKRVQAMVSFEMDSKIYLRSALVRIVEASEHREASCLVRIDHGTNASAFMNLFLPLQVMREEWNLNVSDLFGSLDRMYVSVKNVSDFCAYLQSTWVAEAAKWVKEKVVVSTVRVNKQQ